MWRSRLPKGILGGPDWDHMIDSATFKQRFAQVWECLSNKTKHTFSVCTTRWNRQELTSHDCNTRTVLFWITDIHSQSCVSRLVLSASDIFGDRFVDDDTVWTGDTILKKKRQQSDVIQNWSVSGTRGRRETLTCFEEGERLLLGSWTWRCVQILLKPVKLVNCLLWLLSMHLLQQIRQSVYP
jgi:hypothetical protein